MRVALIAVIAMGCGSAGEPLPAGTVALVETIRGEGEAQRIAAGTAVEIGGLSRVYLDSGPRILIREGSVEVTEEGAVELGGRAFVEVHPGDALQVRVGDLQLSTHDAGFSIEDGSIYVVGGEVRFTRGERSGTIRAGERLRGDTPEPESLWNDWTGGLARPGPGLDTRSAIGSLYARVPDEMGQARWPLVMRRLDVRTRVVDDLAITEVEQVFFNPASERVEGMYRIRVPESAVLQRFAVDRDGELVDGFVREKRQAEAAYEAQVYRGSTLDPALLEWIAAGEYQARIYPIEPGATRRIVVRYAEWLERNEAGNRLYRFPMAGGADAPILQELAFEADLSAAKIKEVSSGFDAEVDGNLVRMRRSDFRPRSDLYLELVDSETQEAQTIWRAEHVAPVRDPRAGAMPDEDELDYVYVPLVLPDSIFGEPAQGLDLVIVADVSAATERSHLELGRTVVESLTAHLGDDDRVAIVASDVALRHLESDAALGPASSDRIERLLDALAREPSGGASDLGAALAQASRLLEPQRNGVVIYVGDAAPTVGELGAEELIQRVQRLPQPLRAYGVAVGGDAHLDLLDAVTRGGGLALRVETRGAAAEAALQILAHAQRPAAHRVSIELEGAQQVFPRGAADVVQGAVLPVLGRIEDDLPVKVKVSGIAGGREFEEEISLEHRTIEDEGDLRLRWAAQRLHQLLLSGGTREEIADLGVRYGIITPFTSFYVPSAAELSAMGPSADRLRRRPPGFEPDPIGRLALLPTQALLSVPGCTDSDAEAPVGSAEQPMVESEVSVEEETVAESAPEDPADLLARLVEEAERQNRASSNARPSNDPAPQEQQPAPIVAEPTEPEPEMAAEATPSPDTTTATTGAEQGQDYARGPTRAQAQTQRERRRGEGGGGGYDRNDNELDDLLGDAVGATADGFASVEGEEDADESESFRDQRAAAARESGVLGALRGGDDDASRALELALGVATAANQEAFEAVTTEVTVRVRTQHRARHTIRRCSDAADLLLDGRREVWSERLDQGGVSHWLTVYRQAARACELRTWRDRRALLDLILAKAGSVQRMVQVYHLLGGSGARNYVRRVILRRVRTPDDLRIARQAFAGQTTDAALIAQVLERAGEGAGKIRALRRLILQFKTDLNLRLMLLEELEKADRIAELRRAAHDLRNDPMTDAGIRTAIGEMYLRLEDEAEARRVFSEIVEFAPHDALARRRLGDIYCAHEWFEDAYRQYETLQRITPDDPSVALLLARAAAGAGRVDEALRLEQGLAESTGGDAGLGRVALLWSSVRFAELRAAARTANDTTQLDALASRMRRGGVLRLSKGLRATLVWSHPDAALSLWAGMPGLGVTRPPDLAPEYGLEAFEVSTQEPGPYAIEVRHLDAGHLTAVSAKLVVVWNEGQADEQIEIRELRFGPEHHRSAFRIRGRALEEVTP